MTIMTNHFGEKINLPENIPAVRRDTATHAAIVNSYGDVIAVVYTHMKAGQIDCSYKCDGSALQYPRQARLTRSQRVMNSRAARQCITSALCIDEAARQFILL